MNEKLSWWQQEPRFLNETLPFINESRACDDAIGCCEHLCKALNKTWNAFYQYRQSNDQLNETELNNGRSDAQSFRELLLRGLSDEQARALGGSNTLSNFANITPRIMNHDTLLRLRYDPDSISEDIIKRASNEHQQLLNALTRFLEMPSDRSLTEALLKKLATLIYIVRSNIAHSEKTPKGPDFEKSKRDKVISEATARVITEVFELLFNKPSQRLAVYGTLMPDEPNAQQLSELEGDWLEGKLEGVIQNRDGFAEFYWKLPGETVLVKILASPQLEQHFGRLDRFEGPRYRRILVPIMIDGVVSVANVYQGVAAHS